MSDTQHVIIYTQTDEAPALATASLLPIIAAFTKTAGVGVELRDISLAARVLAAFADFLDESQRVSDDLTELGLLVERPEANVIKLPNVSASIPQLKSTIEELRSKGFAVPEYPDEPQSDIDRDVQGRYDKIKGSAVNPVLREGNSDRRAPASVKSYARSHPHSMGVWSSDSKTRVAHMQGGDFRSNERSVTMPANDTLRIELQQVDGITVVLKDSLPVKAAEVIDATFMSVGKLQEFLAHQLVAAKAEGILFSVHLKATMMKVSDPIIFGHVVKTFFADVFTKHAAALARVGTDANDGLGDVLARVATLSDAEKADIERDVAAAIANGPDLAMVDSDRGITNLHVPSDVIVDASMPAMIRTSGQMWNAAGNEHDALAVIPDACYAGLYDVVIEDCKVNGAFDPSTIGSVPNVGLMAQKAEEYGSHDKTFEIPVAGTVRVVGAQGVLMEHTVEAGDIWRACQTKDAAIRDWVRLAVARARATGAPAIFWLDETRAHDRELIAKVNAYLVEHDTTALDIRILSPIEATALSIERIRRGEDTISVTGNVLRDYLTDLFPIMELGTSAKMLSIVPLMNGGGLFETGAGGSAPKHVQQFVKEGHLRWDSLGEFLALTASLEHLAVVGSNTRAQSLADALDRATGTLLDAGKSPGRKVGQLDNRGSHFYIALYWAQELCKQTSDPALAALFAPVADALARDEAKIIGEIDATQGSAIDIGGYYFPDSALVDKAMRPSTTFNTIIDDLAARA